MKFVTSDYVVDPNIQANSGFQVEMGACAHSGEVVNPRIFSFVYIFVFLLTCTGRSVGLMNTIIAQTDYGRPM